jgi:hypothetical protein
MSQSTYVTTLFILWIYGKKIELWSLDTKLHESSRLTEQKAGIAH